MATSNIALERVQALLKVDTGNGSLYEHLVRVVRKLAEENPQDALEHLEQLSRHLKQSSFRGEPAPDESKPVEVDRIVESMRQQYHADCLKLVSTPSDPLSSTKVLATVQNFMDDAAMFEWAGVGFGKQESYHIAMSLRKLAAETPALESLRLWGKILGTEGDYLVAEGVFMGAAAAPSSTQWILPGDPEFDVEPRGQGPNTYAYWVSTGGPTSPWIRLPAARASHIVAARKMQRLMVGSLEASVMTMPWFPGEERHLLRAQIARITASCTLAPKGWYVAKEAGDDGIQPPKGALRIGDDPFAEFPSQDDLSNKETAQDSWEHASPQLLKNGRSSWPVDAEGEYQILKLASAIEEEKSPETRGTTGLTPLQKERGEKMGETWTQEYEEHMNELKDPLTTIKGDLESRAVEEGGDTPAWRFQGCGDKGKYFSTKPDEDQVVHRVSVARSMLWPGAVAVSQGKKFANLYVGYALKCGTLIPKEKNSGLPLPLDGCCPYSASNPTNAMIPADIMDEPADLKEFEEPNPQELSDVDDDQGSADEAPE